MPLEEQGGSGGTPVKEWDPRWRDKKQQKLGGGKYRIISGCRFSTKEGAVRMGKPLEGRGRDKEGHVVLRVHGASDGGGNLKNPPNPTGKNRRVEKTGRKN